jgi:hypothetical protein
LVTTVTAPLTGGSGGTTAGSNPLAGLSSITNGLSGSLAKK